MAYAPFDDQQVKRRAEQIPAEGQQDFDGKG
jgi:hypothetical protein